MTKFNELIKNYKHGHNLTNQELADFLGISEDSASKYVCGNRTPMYGVFEKIMEKIGYEVIFRIKREDSGLPELPTGVMNDIQN